MDYLTIAVASLITESADYAASMGLYTYTGEGRDRDRTRRGLLRGRSFGPGLVLCFFC